MKHSKNELLGGRWVNISVEIDALRTNTELAHLLNRVLTDIHCGENIHLGCQPDAPLLRAHGARALPSARDS